MFSKIIQTIISFLYPYHGFDTRLQDPRDFTDDLGWFGYEAKNEKVDLTDTLLRTIDQKHHVTCVVDSGNGIKEVDEGVSLSTPDMASYLQKTGNFSRRGTSLSAYQNALRQRGVCEDRLYPVDYSVTHDTMVSGDGITQETERNAQTHKSKSYWKTHNLSAVIEQLDKGRIGQTGADWRSSYWGTRLKAPYIINPDSGSVVSGHAFKITGYNKNYHGNEVLIAHNTYGIEFGDNGRFFIKFSDFAKVCKYGVYYNEDMDKDTLSWLITRHNVLVKSPSSPHVYLIQNRKKRRVKDEAIMHMLFVTYNRGSYEEDTEGYLQDTEEGDEVTLNDVPQWAQETVRTMVQWSSDKDGFKRIFKPYYPDFF